MNFIQKGAVAIALLKSGRKPNQVIMTITETAIPPKRPSTNGHNTYLGLTGEILSAKHTIRSSVFTGGTNPWVYSVKVIFYFSHYVASERRLPQCATRSLANSSNAALSLKLAPIHDVQNTGFREYLRQDHRLGGVRSIVEIERHTRAPALAQKLGN